MQAMWKHDVEEVNSRCSAQMVRITSSAGTTSGKELFVAGSNTVKYHKLSSATSQSEGCFTAGAAEAHQHFD